MITNNITNINRMKRIILIIMVVIITNLQLIGQSKSKAIDLKWGAEFEESSSITLDEIVGYDNTGFYAVKRKGSINPHLFSIDHFNNELNRTKYLDLVLKDSKEKREREPSFVIHMNNTLYLFSVYFDKREAKNTLFVQTIDKSSFKINNDLRIIMEVIDSDKDLKYHDTPFQYKLSENKSKLLIYKDLPFLKGVNEKFAYQVFDNKMQMLWKKNIECPGKEDLYDVERVTVDNNGNLYLLGVVYNDNRVNSKKGFPNYKYSIHCYTENGSSIKDYPVQIAAKFITDLQFLVTKELDIVCAGFYSNEGTVSIKGTYYLKIDGESKEILISKTKEFGLDFITQNMSEKKAQKTKMEANKGKDVELYKFDLKNLVLREDGGIVMIGEQFYIFVMTQYNSSGASSFTTYYNYNDIIVVNINPDGNIDWAKKIPKHQISKNDLGIYSSFSQAIVEDKLYFIFNDNPKNLIPDKSNPSKIYNYDRSNQKSVVVLVEVDLDGKSKKELLFTTKEATVDVLPKVCQQIKSDELIIFGQWRKFQRFAKLKFN